MTIEEMKAELERHLTERAAIYSRFIVTGEEEILTGVAHHAAKIVELMAQIEILKNTGE